MIKKVILISLIIIFLAVVIIFILFFVGSPPEAKEIKWGVNFSQKHAQNLSLDWKETYSALIDDLGAKNIKLASYWDLIEPEKDKFYFDDLDWQIKKAEEKGVNLLLVIGMKTPRWPECHVPEWAKNLSKEEQQKKILNLIQEIVQKYRERVSIQAWQVENEPMFPFGECPWIDKDFLKKEIDLVKSLDYKNRPVVISDSGEGSFWIQAAKFGDIVGTTMYKKVWFSQLGMYVHYPLTPTFYWRKAQIIKNLFNKKVICIELQAEPWCPALLYDCSLEEQEKTMNLEQFQKNIEFAKKTGFDTFYLWGGERWFWMKEKQSNPAIWNEVKGLLKAE